MSIFHRASIYISKIGQFWQEDINGTILRWNLAIIILQLIFIWYWYTDLPPEIPLFYSRPWGAEQLAGSSKVFLLPMFSFSTVLLNNLLAIFFLRYNLLLSRLLIVVSLLFSIFSFVAVFRSISLII